jgi:Protein O-mannosyl-transferase TMEM260-like
MTEQRGQGAPSSAVAAGPGSGPRIVPSSPRRLATSQLAGIVLILAFAILYWITLDNGLRPGELEGGDLITHQYAQVQGRPSNAPGYPLYTMGGWLWFHVGRAVLGPLSNPISILSSYSTLWALLALWLLYRLILEITDRGDGGNWVVGALVTAFYGVTYFFWYYAVTTEQYTSAVAWTLAMIYLTFRWEHVRRNRYLLAIALLVGVGLAHMVTVLFLVPPLLCFLLSADPLLLRRPRLVAAAIGVATLPLLSYAFVYFSGATHPEWQGAGASASTWQWFWSFLSTSQGRGELTWSLTPFATAEFPALIWREMTWPGLLMGLIGLAALGRRRASLLYATVAIYLVFAWVDRLGNWYQVVMPAYAILALGIAAAANWAWGLGSGGAREQLGGVTLSKRIHLVVVAGLCALAIARGVSSYPLADSSDRPDDTGLAPGWSILADQPPEGLRVLATVPEALALDYLAEIWGARPDVRTVSSAQAREIMAAGSPLLAATEAAPPLVSEEVSSDAHYGTPGGKLVDV